VAASIRVERYQWLTADKNPKEAIFVDAYHYKNTSVMYNVRQATELPHKPLNPNGTLKKISEQNKAQWARNEKGEIREGLKGMRNPQDQKYPPTNQQSWQQWAKMFYEWSHRFKLVAVVDRQTGESWEVIE